MWTGVYHTPFANLTSWNNWILTSEQYYKFLASETNVIILQSREGDLFFKTIGYEEYSQIAKVNLEKIKKIGVASKMQILGIPVQYKDEQINTIKW